MAVNPKKDALTSSDLAGAIPEDFVGAVNKNAKFAPGDVAYCRAFACNARVMSVGTTKSGICNYKVALYDAKGVPTGEAVCSESDLVRRSVRGLKLTGLASGASRACDVAATILEKMVQRNKVDLPLAKKVLRLTQRDFPDARVSVAAAKLNENPPALLSAAKILRAEANRLRAQGKTVKGVFDNPTPQDAAETYKMFLNTWERMTQGMESRGQDPRDSAMHWKNVISEDRLYSRVPETTRVYQLLLSAQRAPEIPSAFKFIKQALATLRSIVRKLESGNGFRSVTTKATPDGLMDLRNLRNAAMRHFARTKDNIADYRGVDALYRAIGQAIERPSFAPAKPHLRAAYEAAESALKMRFRPEGNGTRNALARVVMSLNAAVNALPSDSARSMKAMRAAVKRAPAEALPMIAPLHSKLLMVYRKFIGSPETASLGSLPALAAQWKAVGNKLPDEEQSGVALIVRDLISAYRSFTKEQTKNVAYFLAMALGTANKMVGGSANVPIPAHLRSVKADQTQVRAFHAALDELRELSMKINQLRANPVGGIKKDLLKGLWTKPDRANNILVGAGIDIPGYQQQTRQTIALIDKIAQRGTGSPEGVYGDLLFDNLYSVAIEKQFVNMLNRIFDSTGKLTVLLSQYRQSQREWPVASVKAIDAKEYYEKNKKIPVGSILRVNGKLVQVERANGYVISGYEYKKPQSTNTHVSVDLRNTPATLLSVGNGTFRFARDGNVVFGRRPAN